MIKKLYFDMDGVLVDWDRSLEDLGIKNQYGEEFHTYDWLYREIDTNNFFHRLHPSDHLEDWIDMIRVAKCLFGEDSVGILSSLGGCPPGIDTKAAEQKERWLLDHIFPHEKIHDLNFVEHKEHKRNYADEGCWLIDDNPENVATFIYNGNQQAFLYSIENHEQDYVQIATFVTNFLFDGRMAEYEFNR